MPIFFTGGKAMFFRRRQLLVLIVVSAGLVLVGLGLWKMDAEGDNRLEPLNEGVFAAIQDA